MRQAVILAAGKGTRMKSATPKVMHEVLGQSMVSHVIQTLNESQIEQPIVVIGHESEMVRNHLMEYDIQIVEQTKQLGTGHAVMQTREKLSGQKATTIVALGDTPLLSSKTLNSFFQFHEQNKSAITVLTTRLSNPTGYGRIIRNNNGQFLKIVEQKDGTPEELLVNEVNSGVMCFDNELLWEYIDQIDTNNAQGEYYLTDLIGIFSQNGHNVQAYCIEDSDEVYGVNDRKMLSYAENVLRTRINDQWMVDGVTFENESTSRIGRNVKLGNDVVIGSGVEILGNSIVGNFSSIGSQSILINTEIGENTQILSSRITDTKIGNNVNVGPYAHLRQGNVIEDHVRIGNFVEFKGSKFGRNSKSAHLSYIGDSEIGSNTNIGCGTITVNYDGFHKYKTIVGDDVFIGCNSNLIAPITIGDKSIIAAGSTITQSIGVDDLAIARAKQVTKEKYASKLRARQQIKK